MKKTNLLATLLALILTAFMAACADDHTTDSDQKQNPEKVGTVFIGTNTIKIADNPATRTSLDYTFGENDFNFFWEPGDFVWNRGNWDMFFTNITKKAKLAKFTSSNQYTDTEIPITFCGTNSAAPYAVIFSDLTQAEPNNTAHLGDGGDCGIGKAKRQPDGVYRFTLEHRSAYLCLLPRTPNGLTSTVITKVTITSDNAIIGYSYLQADGNLSTPTGGTGQDLKKQVITLGTGGQGFPLNNAQTSQATNAIYSVIYPGTHALTIEYSLKDTQTGVEGTVTKTIPSQNYAPNTLTPITANLKVIAPSLFPYTKGYYLWDAKQEYWYNSLNADGTPDFSKSPYYVGKAGSGDRWYNESYPGQGIRNDATQNELFKKLPNVNEMFWYASRGDAHWVESNEIYSYGDHLWYIGGIWLKKKSTILRDNPDVSEHRFSNSYPDSYGVDKDWRTTNGNDPIPDPQFTPIQGAPANTDDYFFLPALGYFSNGAIGFGFEGYYWGSSAITWPTAPHPGAWTLWFWKSLVRVTSIDRLEGYQARPFE